MSDEEKDDSSSISLGCTVNGSTTSAVAYTYVDSNISTSFSYNDLVFTGSDIPKSIGIDELVELPDRIKKIEDMLNILNDPDPEILEKYGALRTAFQKYKMLEKLILDPDQIK